MTGNELPKPDHVLRYAAPQHIDDDGSGRRILGSAFWSRPVDNNMASYNWLEKIGAELEECVQAVRDRKRLRYAKTALLGKLNIGEVEENLASAFPKLPKSIFKHDPLEATEEHCQDDSHSLLINMPAKDEPFVEAMGDLIAEYVQTTFPAFEEK